MKMTQEQIVRELRGGLPIHRHSGDPEPRLSPRSVACVHSLMSVAANLIETLSADRESAMRDNAELLKEVGEMQSDLVTAKRKRNELREALGLMIHEYCVSCEDGVTLDHKDSSACKHAFHMLGLEQGGDISTLEDWLFPEYKRY